MSEDPDPTETLTAARDGIRVEKRFNPDEFAVPTIQFTIVSEREDRADITLSDQIPAEFPMDGVGFHPDYEGGHWSYGEGCVTFEWSIEPGESVTTVYGIRIAEPSEVVPFLAEPELAEISPVADGSGPSEPREIDADRDEQTIDDIVPESSTGVVRELLTDESASVPGLEQTGESEAADAPTAVDEDPLAADPLVDDPVGADPLADEPIGEDPLSDEPTGKDPLADDPVADDPVADDPVADDSLAEPLQLDDPVEPSDVDSEATSDSSTPESTDDIELDLDGVDAGSDDEVVAAVEDDGAASVDDPTIPVLESTSADGTGESPDGVAADGQGSESGSETEGGAASSEGLDTTEAASVGGPGTAVTEGGIAAALADELRSDSIDEADLDVLRTALRLERSDSERARMSHLQSRVSDLEAYIDALEEFIDEHGTVDRLFEEIRSESASISEQVSDLETLVAANTEDVTALDTEVSAIDERVADVSNEVAEASNEVAEVSNEVADVADEVEHASESIDALEADLSAVATDVESNSATIDSFDEELTGVRAAVEDIEDEFDDRVAAAREDVESDVEALEDRLETVRDDIDALVEWRDQLGEMFSGSR